LSPDIEKIIKHKAAIAYQFSQVPVIVEHGGLYIEYLRNYPGPLSKPMWDVLEDNICDLIPANQSRKASAFSAVCYCDGRKRIFCIESTEGQIAQKGRGNNGFQWDYIFIPNGETRTYAEMSQTEKLNYSQAAKAYRALRKLLIC
jgi:XTP/dITP diphosphohydrolase